MDRHRRTEQPPSGAGAVAVQGVSRQPGLSRAAGPWRIILATVARVILLTAVCLLGWSAAPAALGWAPTTVMTGSMEPRIHPGDVVVARPVPSTELAVGQVLLVDDPDHPGRLRLHRFVAAAPDGSIILRGDANRTDDSTHVQPSAVHGVGFIRVPLVGMPVLWLAERRMVALGLLTGAVMLLLAAARLDRRPPQASNAAYTPAQTPGSGQEDPGVTPPVPATDNAPEPISSTAGRRRVLVGAGAALAVVVVSAAGLVGVHAAAGATFSSPAKNPTSSLSASTAFSCLAPTVSDSPYLFYGFNEGSGSTAPDASGNGRTGTLVGGTSWLTGSCAGDDSPALTLSTNGYVSTPTRVSAAPTTMSMELWIRTSTTSGGVLMDFGSSQTGSSSATDRVLYLTDAGKVAFGVYASVIGAEVATSPKAYNDGQWHQVVATLSGTSMSLYVDGARVTQKTTATSGRANAGYWRVGQDAIASSWTGAPSSTSFEGTVDDAAVYTTALSSTRVSAHYTAGR